jgi:hypothetical protein
MHFAWMQRASRWKQRTCPHAYIHIHTHTYIHEYMRTPQMNATPCIPCTTATSKPFAATLLGASHVSLSGLHAFQMPARLTCSLPNQRTVTRGHGHSIFIIVTKEKWKAQEDKDWPLHASLQCCASFMILHSSNSCKHGDGLSKSCGVMIELFYDVAVFKIMYAWPFPAPNRPDNCWASMQSARAKPHASYCIHAW